MNRNTGFSNLKKGIILSLPIMLGYIPVGMAFGSSAVSLGFAPLETVLISVLIFAGSSQFALITLMNSSHLMAFIIPVFLNMRHIIYSSIVAHKIKISVPHLTAFGLTDEVFATSVNQEGDEKMLIGLEIGAYFSWIVGTMVGAFGSSKLLEYDSLSRSLSFSLVSLFFGLLIPHLNRREIGSAILGGFIAGMFYLLNQASLGILLAGILSPMIVNLLRGKENE